MKWNIIMTFSKTLSLIMFCVTSVYAFYTKDSAPMMLTIPICAVNIVGKQYFDSKVKKVE